ncbi:MAG TPA: hypothetical protein VHW66_19090 [Stellaceae bacterium]|jgi:hypothetical protein|nr:hypothetical protein [Stellaceae bacterium]
MADPATLVEGGVWQNREDGSLYFALGRARDETHDEAVIVFVPVRPDGECERFTRREVDFLEWYRPVDALDPAWLLREWGTQLSEDVARLAKSGVSLVSAVMEMAKQIAMNLALYDDEATRHAVMEAVVKLLPVSVNQYLAVKSQVAEAKAAPRH